MIEITHLETYGWQPAIRHMRNPMNSWGKSDSIFYIYDCGGITGNIMDDNIYFDGKTDMYLGENDLDLMTRLIKAGPEHRKFLREIAIWCDITAPLYWWKQFDTYNVGVTKNSCSTMHKIHAKEFDISDFSVEHLYEKNLALYNTYLIPNLNYYRERYLETKDKDDWWQLIQLLPDTYIQTRGVTMNYEVIRKMYHERKNHKLDEWVYFCNFMEENLPHSELIAEG